MYRGFIVLHRGFIGLHRGFRALFWRISGPLGCFRSPAMPSDDDGLGPTDGALPSGLGIRV